MRKMSNRPMRRARSIPLSAALCLVLASAAPGAENPPSQGEETMAQGQDRQRQNLSGFLEDLSRFHATSGVEALDALHGELRNMLLATPEDRTAIPRIESRYLYDYHYFFNEVLPRFHESAGVPSVGTGPDARILASFPPGRAYTAGFSREKVAAASKGRFVLEMTGAYTSELGHPAGLFITGGRILNPALQKWDGLILIDGEGHLHLARIDQLMVGLESLDIRGNQHDYLSFLKYAEDNRISVAQSHIWVQDGKSVVSERASPVQERRKALFTDSAGVVHVFDSREENLSLAELATMLVTTYHARMVINLDSGSHAHGALYENGAVVTDYGTHSAAVSPSNFLYFAYDETTE